MAQKFFIKSDTFIYATETKDAETGEYIDDATVKMSICDGVKLHPDIALLTFTSGGIYEIEEGDTIVGSKSAATARVSTIIIEKGSWATGNACGKLGLLCQHGTFIAESLNVGQELNIASILLDSIGAEDATAGDVWIPISNHNLQFVPDADWVIIDGSRYYDGLHVLKAVEAQRIKITATFKEEKFSGEEDIYRGLPNGKELVLGHEATDAAGYYDGVLLNTITGMEEDEFYYLFVIFEKNGIKTTNRVYWKAVFYPDAL